MATRTRINEDGSIETFDDGSGAGDSARSHPREVDVNTAAIGSDAPAVGARGPNGRKLNKDGTERRAKGSAGNAPGGKEKIRKVFVVDTFANLLVVLHSLAETFTKVPEWHLDKSEAAMLAGAVKPIADRHGIAPSDETQEIVALIGVVGMVYGTRIGAYNIRKRAEKRATRVDAMPMPGAPQNTAAASAIRDGVRMQAPVNGVPSNVAPPDPSIVHSPDGDPVSIMPKGSAAMPPGQGRSQAQAAFEATPDHLM